MLISFVCPDQLLFRDRVFLARRAQFSPFKTIFYHVVIGLCYPQWNNEPPDWLDVEQWLSLRIVHVAGKI